MPRSTLFRVFRPVNSVNQNSFQAVPSSRLASDEAGFVAPTSLQSFVAGHNNILPGGANEEAKEETCAIPGGDRQEESGNSDNTSGGVGGSQQNSAEKATGQRGRVHSLVVQFFVNWHREAQPLDPERRHSFSSPRTTAPHVPVPVRLPLARIPALSPSLDEIHAKLICNLVPDVKFGALWDISDKRFVLFQDSVTKTSLALPLDSNFCVQLIRSHLRESRHKFGIVEDL